MATTHLQHIAGLLYGTRNSTCFGILIDSPRPPRQDTLLHIFDNFLIHMCADRVRATIENRINLQTRCRRESTQQQGLLGSNAPPETQMRLPAV